MKDDHALILHTPMVCFKMMVPITLKEQLQLLIIFVSLLSLSFFCINFLMDKCMGWSFYIPTAITLCRR